MSLLPSHTEVAEAAAIELLAIELHKQDWPTPLPGNYIPAPWAKAQADIRRHYRIKAARLIAEEYPE